MNVSWFSCFRDAGTARVVDAIGEEVVAKQSKMERVMIHGRCDGWFGLNRCYISVPISLRHVERHNDVGGSIVATLTSVVRSVGLTAW